MTARSWVALAGLALAIPAGAHPKVPPPAVRVIIRDHTFRPSVVTIRAGQRIVWINEDQDPHTITSGAANVDDDRWRSSSLIPDGASFALRLKQIGTYPYFCKPHQFQDSMHGTIVVRR